MPAFIHFVYVIYGNNFHNCYKWGQIKPLINGLKYMGNWGYFTPISRVISAQGNPFIFRPFVGGEITPFISSRGPYL